MSDLERRLALAAAEYLDRDLKEGSGHISSSWKRDGDLTFVEVDAYVDLVALARAVALEVLAAMRGWTDEAGAADVEDRDVCEIILRNFAREHGLEPPGER